MIDIAENTIDTRYSPKDNCKWKTYNNYKLIIWAWMLNDVSVVTSVGEISHNGYYIHLLLYGISLIFLGIPLAYSEICIAQYTNGGVMSTWNFIPIFRSLCVGTIYLGILKTIYVLALTSWYLLYTFYATLDPPPWFSCDDFKNTKCMVKRINVSIFQQCLEAQTLFNDDCEMKTASNCFFEREIGCNNSMTSIFCALSWKSIIASVTISTFLFIFSFRKMKFIQVAVKILVVYLSVVALALLLEALSASGAWYTKKITIDWSKYTLANCSNSAIRGFLSAGTGFGIIGFLSKDVPFRSPATMTSISSTLLSFFVTSLFALIAFIGIKTMSYYHGEIEIIIEIGISSFFTEFGSMSEIVSYFDQAPIWGFAWFSSIFLCMLINSWLLYLFLNSLVTNSSCCAHRNKKVCSALLTTIIIILTCPLFCSDIAGAISHAIQIIQIISNLIFSVSLYWVYGYNAHSIDIMFMIGIKPNFFWKIAWVSSPIIIFSMLYLKLTLIESQDFGTIQLFKVFGKNHDILIIYILVSVYVIVSLIGVIIQLIFTYRNNVSAAFLPRQEWGPKDDILYKSRKMFVPKLMTREFLYRQVRIHGCLKKLSSNKITECSK